MKILSNQEINVIVNRTIQAQNLSSVALVERAALAFAAEIRSLCSREHPLLVLAGWGGNGAEALETARLLALEGYEPQVYLFNIGGRSLSDVCAAMKQRIRQTAGVKFCEVTGSEPFGWPDPTPDTTVIDGLFGSGLGGELPRPFQLIAQSVTQSGARVIALDIPSGLTGEWNGNRSRANMFHADLTLAIEFPRLAFMLGDNADVVGMWKVVRAGYDATAIRQAPFTYYLVDRALVSNHLYRRKIFSSKADYGNAMIFAGSRGMFGAAILTAQGALRAGAGKVTVHSALDGATPLQTAVPSAMFSADGRQHIITNMQFDDRYNAVAVGPGIGTHDDTADALEKLAKAASAAGRRLILDADALNIIARRPNLLNYLTPLSVITPHAGEFDRIFGKSENDEDRLKKAIQCSEDYNIIIVLKGHHTAIVRPDGKIMFNSSGTPALATPGSGDVLTGIIAGLMATGLKSEIAAFVGPYIHGVAGELAEAVQGQYGVTATDIAMNVGCAIKSIMES